MQSSPSPTSIITNINQSNFLCSQTPDPQSGSGQNFKENNVFQHPGPRRETKPSQFRQVVIVQTQNATQETDAERTIKRTQSQRSYIANGQLSVPLKSNQDVDSVQEQTKQENYNFKNLAINNYTRDFSNTSEYRTQLQSKVYEQQVKSNNFDFIKPKLYLTYGESNSLVQNQHSHDTSSNEFKKETKVEPNKEKPDSSESMNTDVSFNNCVDKNTKLNGFDSTKNEE